MAPATREEVMERVRAIFDELTASGLAPNDAGIKALERAHDELSQPSVAVNPPARQGASNSLDFITTFLQRCRIYTIHTHRVCASSGRQACAEKPPPQHHDCPHKVPGSKAKHRHGRWGSGMGGA